MTNKVHSYLADIAEILVQQLNKEMDRLHKQQLVVSNIGSEDEVKSSVATVNQFVILVLRKTLWMTWAILHSTFLLPLTSTKFVFPRVRAAITRFTSDSNFARSVSSGGVTYHLESLVFPCLFWRRKNRICDGKAIRNWSRIINRKKKIIRGQTYHCGGSMFDTSTLQSETVDFEERRKYPPNEYNDLRIGQSWLSCFPWCDVPFQRGWHILFPQSQLTEESSCIPIKNTDFRCSKIFGVFPELWERALGSTRRFAWWWSDDLIATLLTFNFSKSSEEQRATGQIPKRAISLRDSYCGVMKV